MEKRSLGKENRSPLSQKKKLDLQENFGILKNMEPNNIEKIDNLLSKLPKQYLKEVEDFIAYLLSKVKKKKAFEERVLKAEKEPTIKFNSVDEAMKAIINEAEKD